MKDKRQVFGIPYPLTLETILNAMDQSWEQYYLSQDERKMRQFTAFRARILRLDAEKVEIIKILDNQYVVLSNALKEKDARIAELENKMSGPQINWRS